MNVMQLIHVTRKCFTPHQIDALHEACEKGLEFTELKMIAQEQFSVERIKHLTNEFIKQKTSGNQDQLQRLIAACSTNVSDAQAVILTDGGWD